MSIRTAVFPVAGYGTRMLPATKAIPKEMVTLIDKPLIQYAVEEAIDSGIERIIFITGRSKKALEDHFDISVELNDILEKSGNIKLLNEVKKISEMIDVIYLRQKRMAGLGDAILCVKDIVKDEPFVVILPDDIILSKTPVVRQIINEYERYRSPIVATMKVDINDCRKYGIVKPKERINERLTLLETMVEKPESNPPSDEAIIGRYVINNDVMQALESCNRGNNNEIQLTDALKYVAERKNVYGYMFEGKRFDCGNPTGLLDATINFAANRDDLKGELTKILSRLNM